MQKISYHLKVLWLTVSYLFQKNYIANVCGHQTKQEGVVTSQGESYILKMPLADNNHPDYCLDCISKMSVRCAWCEKPINIGHPVTLYLAPSPKEGFKIPEGAVRYFENNDEGTECLVGCLRFECAVSGADRQGFWIPPGKVARVPSPIELLLSQGNQDKTKMVIVSDLSDPNDLGKFV